MTVVFRINRRMVDDRAMSDISLMGARRRAIEKRRGQCGAISLDMLFTVLGILGLIAIILTNFPKIMEAIDRFGAESQLSTLVANIRNAYQTQPNYTGIDNATVLSLNLVPSNMGTTASLTDKFKGAAVISSDTGTLAGDLTISFSGIPQTSCVSMVNDNAGAIAVEATTGGPWIPVPTTPVVAGTLCTQSENTLIWAYR